MKKSMLQNFVKTINKFFVIYVRYKVHQTLDRILFSTDFNRFGVSANGKLFDLILKNVESSIYEIGIQKDDLISSCTINKKPCSWSEILTQDGLCFSFNLIGPEEMFHQNM